METKVYTTIDRAAAGWPSGEWDTEPDKMQWPDEATGLPCLAVRHPRMGFLCGYVGVPPEHPLYGKSYDHLSLEVHGGLTFSAKCHPAETESAGVCHVPGQGEPDHVWWFGFDCAHLGDSSPAESRDGIDPHSNYKNLPYVQSECRQLASQLKDYPKESR